MIAVHRWQDGDGWHVSVTTTGERETVLFLSPEQAEAVERAIRLAMVAGVEQTIEDLRRFGAVEADGG